MQRKEQFSVYVITCYFGEWPHLAGNRRKAFFFSYIEMNDDYASLAHPPPLFKFFSQICGLKRLPTSLYVVIYKRAFYLLLGELFLFCGLSSKL